MLWFLGVGPTDKDISLKALEIINNADTIFLEGYTNFLGKEFTKRLRKIINKDFKTVDRNFIENNMENVIEEAKNKNIVIITVGNPLVATTHFYYFIEGRRRGVKVEFIHSPSIQDLVLETGLHFYKFGKTASISFHYSEYPYEVIKENLSIGAHTLLLLDLDPMEGKFMKIKDGIGRLLEIEEKRKEGLIKKDTYLIGCARLGMENKKIVYARVRDLLEIDFGDPPYCIIYPGKLHFTEEEALELWKYENNK